MRVWIANIDFTGADFSRDVHLVTEDPSATGGRHDLEMVVLRRLMGVASHLVEMGIRFVGCQKVIHPLLRDFWREKARGQTTGNPFNQDSME